MTGFARSFAYKLDPILDGPAPTNTCYWARQGISRIHNDGFAESQISRKLLLTPLSKQLSEIESESFISFRVVSIPSVSLRLPEERFSALACRVAKASLISLFEILSYTYYLLLREDCQF